MRVGHRALRQAAIAPSTLRLYSRALGEFEQFARSRRLPLSGNRLANSMERFFWHCADRGLSPAIGRAALYGWLHLRSDRPTVEANNLEGPRRAILGWAKLAADHPRDPMPEEMVLQISREILRSGKPRTAAAVVVALYTYGRPGEVVNIFVDDVILPSSGAGPRYRTTAILFGASERGLYTKTGQQDDTVVIDDRCPAYLSGIVKELAARAPSERIFGDLTLSGFETAVKGAAHRLGYKYFAIVPHTFRHSGPSNDMYHKRRKLPEIQKRGRWKSVRSVARYEKSGRLLRQWGRLTPSQQSKARSDAAMLPRELLAALRAL